MDNSKEKTELAISVQLLNGIKHAKYHAEMITRLAQRKLMGQE